MIYSEAFDALPQTARNAVFSRLLEVLSGEDTSAKYTHLSPSDRLAILEILRETKKGLPGAFSPRS